ncbi:MAG: DNA polymerase III subunit delta' [Bdellovibrio sp.]|nr:DNA polymerase III subunit delta' [Methylotenera sp.]
MYSWQQSQWQQIMQRASLPHALLLRGREGIGKHELAIKLSQSLLCAAPKVDKTACGTCQNCVWFAEEGHPDFKLIAPEDVETSDEAPKKKAAKKSQISVAQIRQLIDYLSLSSHQVNSRRVVLISPAETLNTASANALLKMLEEPPTNTIFLLVTSQPQRLLATIISRCQAIDMPLPAKADSLHWLQQQGISNVEQALNLAGGAPLLALQIAEEGDLIATLTKHLSQGAQLDAFACAPLFTGLGMGRAIDALQKWVFDLAACKLAQQLHYHLSHSNALQALSKSVNLSLLLRFQQQLLEAKKLVNHPLNNELQLENILLQYTQLFKPVKLR